MTNCYRVIGTVADRPYQPIIVARDKAEAMVKAVHLAPGLRIERVTVKCVDDPHYSETHQRAALRAA